MKKIIVSILFFAILFPSFFSFVISADTVSASNDEIKISTTADLPVTSCEGAMKDEETKDKLKTFRDKDASHLEQFALDLFELLINAVNINTLEQLLFGNPYCIWFDDWGEEKMVFGLFPEKLYTNIVEPGFLFFISLLMIVTCITVMINGLKLMIPGPRVNIGEEFLVLIGVIIGIAAYWLFIDILLNINYAFVLSIADLIKDQGIDLSSFSLTMSVERFEFTDVLILFSEWIILFFLNILYMVRLIFITILLFAGGLAIILALFKSTRTALSKWLLDLVGNVFMQSIHAVYFAMVLLFLSLGDLSFFFKFVLLLLFLPLSSMLLNMAGFASAITATSGANKTVANAANAIRMAKVASQSSAGRLRSSATTPNSLSTGSTKISGLAKGSTGWQKLAGGAQLAGGLAGATAGLVLGPSGALIGSEIGSKMAGGALQVPRNVTAGMKGILDTRGQVKSGTLDSENISDKRQIYGSYGESIGSMFGRGLDGRKLGESLSGVTRERLLNSKELGGLGGVTLSDIAQKYPESKVLFEQNNMGSGFYLQNGEVKTPISPIGQADSSLPDGFTRTIEYELVIPGSANHLPTDDLTSQPSMMNGDNMGIYKMSEAPMIRNDEDNSKVFDHAFDSSQYTPEQHCNMGDFSHSVSNLNSDTPLAEGRNLDNE